MSETNIGGLKMIAWSFPQIDLSAPIVLPQIQLIRGRSDHQSELQFEMTQQEIFSKPIKRKFENSPSQK